MQRVYIDQVCRIDNGLSVGAYASPNLWVESTGIQGGNITTSNNINAGVNIYATDGLVTSKTLEVTTASTFTGVLTANEIRASTITYNDVSGTDKLIIKGGSTLEYQNNNNYPLFNVSSLPNRGFTLHCHLLMNNWSITGGMNIACGNDVVGGNDVIATNDLKGKYFKITPTSTFDGDITAPNIYTKSEVNTLLLDKASTSALADKQNKITIVSTIELQQVNAVGTIFCNRLVSNSIDTQSATLRFRVNTNTDVLSLTSYLIRLISPILIEQGCKIQNGLSVGSYSLVNPSLWVETASIMNGIIYSSNNLTAGGNIYATDGSVNCKTLQVSSTSTFSGDITAPNIYTKQAVNDLLTAHAKTTDISTAESGKQNVLIFRDPAQLIPPVQGFPLLKMVMSFRV